ncbi:MAG: hypothetical protein KKF80_03070 [Candidatus Omnitrophica bacterium]|nr:hypothetical protein [Candidatus Omnitrophota bacterium]
MNRLKHIFSKRKIHPFPARMAPSIVLSRLSNTKKFLNILDPMMGSGTTLAVARACGHRAIGFDTDPLAVLIAKVWCSDVETHLIQKTAKQVSQKAEAAYRKLPLRDAYPENADEATRNFIRFWFDETNRKQLAALAMVISEVNDYNSRSFLWCAFSRLIITKKVGVSLAMDVSHSRPHKVYDRAPVKALDQFSLSVDKILKAMPHFENRQNLHAALIKRADARSLPLKDKSIDMVITSPPYLNAIDYMRGHKLSLVWMGNPIKELREIRASNIGTELALKEKQYGERIAHALEKIGKVSDFSARVKGMLVQYLTDMDKVILEIKRVLVANGRVTFVVGNSSIKGVFVQNSEAIKCLARENGLRCLSKTSRPIPENHRYLPPPSLKKSGKKLGGRMREEVIISFENSAKG